MASAVASWPAHRTKRPFSNLLDDLYKRSIDNSFVPRFNSKYVFSPRVVRQLNLDSELRAHEGCVNCLEWNQAGNLLASGSDDLNIMIWSPFHYRQEDQHDQNTRRLLHASIPTKHRGNIFGVKFLPHTHDTLVASCAADRDIFIYDVNHSSRPLSSVRSGDLPPPLHSIHTHTGRVKRLETSQSEPFLFWSCGEDGLVLEHDIRLPKTDRSRLIVGYSRAQANLSNKNKLGAKKESSLSSLEAKCLAVNQVRSEYLAVGCNDPFARVYDRRALRLRRMPERTGISDASIEDCLFEYAPSTDAESDSIPISFFVPGHLPFKIDEYRKRMKTLSVTFLTFSPLGDKLLVNLGGEQLYLYDFTGTSESTPPQPLKFDSYKRILKEDDISSEGPKPRVELPAAADLLKQKANACFEEKSFVEAIEYYNRAIEIAPNSPILFGNRAAALMKRGWEGDVYAAMRDCYQALELDSSHLKSHFRLAKCLNDLGWHAEARECIQIFSRQHPDYARTPACENLVKEINESVRKAANRNKQQQNSNKRFKRSRNHSQDDPETHPNSSNSKSRDDDSDLDMWALETSSTEEETRDEHESSESSKFSKGASVKISKKLIELYRQTQTNAQDFTKRYCGHCNVATDIKEANFLGEDFIAAGSDDGCIFIWEKKSTNIVRVLKGDESIVNCVQPHPNSCFVATSGIDPHVRIWSPRIPDVDELYRKRTSSQNIDSEEAHLDQDTDDEEDSRVVRDIRAAEIHNHRQMNSHPFEFLFLNLAQNWDNDDEEETTGGNPSIRCSQS